MEGKSLGTGNPYTIEKEKQNRTDLNQELRKKRRINVSHDD
jgi:hypothetical protein